MVWLSWCFGLKIFGVLMNISCVVLCMVMLCMIEWVVWILWVMIEILVLIS